MRNSNCTFLSTFAGFLLLGVKRNKMLMFQMLSEKEREMDSETPMMRMVDNGASRFVSPVGYR